MKCVDSIAYFNFWFNSISVEYQKATGNILPIGLPVCSMCKERHLKGVAFIEDCKAYRQEGNTSNLIMSTLSNSTSANNSHSLLNMGGIHAAQSPKGNYISLPFVCKIILHKIK